MDPVSESCLNLSQLQGDKKDTRDHYLKVLGSCVSIGEYEEKSLKNLLPQILAALAVNSFRVVLGISLSYSAILLAQLEKNDDFTVSKADASWIASILALTSPVGSVVVGFLMDRYGRLWTMKMAALPVAAGWIAIATAQNVYMLIIARALTGFGNSLGVNPSIVYLTEISRKDMRGSLLNIGPALTSTGMILTFILGWFVNWRHVAWTCTVLTIIPSVFVSLIPESPSWLVSKGRLGDAKKSLQWLNKYQPQPKDKESTLAELQLALLEKEVDTKKARDGRRKNNKLHEFFKPTFYKPLAILVGLSLIQQFTGIFIFLFYSITFLQEVGIKMNPYLASIFVGILRLVVCLINTYIMKIFGKRSLIIFSVLGMGLSIFLSGFFTGQSWFSVAFLLLFVMFSMVGLVPIPFTIAAEAFPLEVRGVAYSLFNSINSILMFLTLRLYPVLVEFFGGMQELQYFFGVVCLVGFVYVLFLVPETHKKKLSEIEDYFRDNFVYLCRKTTVEDASV